VRLAVVFVAKVCYHKNRRNEEENHLFGNGGMGTRMCVLVAPSDYTAAKKAMMEHHGIQGDI